MMSGMGYQRRELNAWNEVVWTVVLTKAFHGHLRDDEDHVIEDSDDNQVWAVLLTQA